MWDLLNGVQQEKTVREAIITETIYKLSVISEVNKYVNRISVMSDDPDHVSSDGDHTSFVVETLSMSKWSLAEFT